MGRKSKLKKQRKSQQANLTTDKPKEQQEDNFVQIMTHQGYGDHNMLRSPEIQPTE